MELVTGKALAADLGVAPMSVTRARQRGRIAFADVGRKLYDRTAARVDWEVNRQRFQMVAPAPTAAPTGSPAASPAASVGSAMHDARLRRERAEAALAERRLHEAEGELCRVGEVRRALGDFVAGLARQHNDLAHRLAPELTGKSQTEIFRILDAWQRDCRTQVVAECRRLWGLEPHA